MTFKVILFAIFAYSAAPNVLGAPDPTSDSSKDRRHEFFRKILTKKQNDLETAKKSLAELDQKLATIPINERIAVSEGYRARLAQIETLAKGKEFENAIARLKNTIYDYQKEKKDHPGPSISGWGHDYQSEETFCTSLLCEEVIKAAADAQRQLKAIFADPQKINEALVLRKFQLIPFPKSADTKYSSTRLGHEKTDQENPLIKTEEVTEKDLRKIWADRLNSTWHSALFFFHRILNIQYRGEHDLDWDVNDDEIFVSETIDFRFAPPATEKENNAWEIQLIYSRSEDKWNQKDEPSEFDSATAYGPAGTNPLHESYILNTKGEIEKNFAFGEEYFIDSDTYRKIQREISSTEAIISSLKDEIKDLEKRLQSEALPEQGKPASDQK